ncbi:MAG: hypothetical protein FLDDKLPJ_02208 [Phycisphaerae bacterium]|nr:hypothetical protein [Phycisphaerae bacterium]
MRYTYDAWNRLVKVTRKQDTDIVIQTAEYDGLGRRTQKVVTKSGELDGTFVYYYADTRAAGFSPREFSCGGGLAGIGGASPGGWSIVEIRDGSNNVYQQVYHGTQYIDEIVAMRLEKGYAVVYQAEADQGGRAKDWNTIATCDLAGRVLERVFTTPYGSPIIEPETFFGDYDGDGDVDSTDDASLGNGQTCWGTPSGACRVFDFNHDGTLNASDETILTALIATPSTNHRHESKVNSPTGLVFLHQGLSQDFSTKSYYNRSRVSHPALQLFQQADSLGYIDGMNHYAYARRNPVRWRDFSGKGCMVEYECSVSKSGHSDCCIMCTYSCTEKNRIEFTCGSLSCEDMVNKGILQPPGANTSQYRQIICSWCCEWFGSSPPSKCPRNRTRKVWLCDIREPGECDVVTCHDYCDLYFDSTEDICDTLENKWLEYLCKLAKYVGKPACYAACDAACD